MVEGLFFGNGLVLVLLKSEKSKSVQDSSKETFLKAYHLKGNAKFSKNNKLLIFL